MATKNKEQELEDFCRKRSIEVHRSENGNKKADLWICGDIKISTGKETQCYECGVICYYDTKLKDYMKKKHKKICLKCVYKNHLKDMTALEQSIIKQRAKIEKWEQSP